MLSYFEQNTLVLKAVGKTKGWWNVRQGEC